MPKNQEDVDFKLLLYVFPESHKDEIENVLKLADKLVKKYKSRLKQAFSKIKECGGVDPEGFAEQLLTLLRDEIYRVTLEKRAWGSRFYNALAICRLRERFVRETIGVFDMFFEEIPDEWIHSSDPAENERKKLNYAIQDPLRLVSIFSGIPAIGVDMPELKRNKASVEERNKYMASEIKRRCKKFAKEKGKKNLVCVLVTGDQHVKKGLVKDIKNEMGTAVRVEVCRAKKESVKREVKLLRRERGEFLKIHRVFKK